MHLRQGVREVGVAVAQLNILIDGTGVADLSALTSQEATIVDAINDSYPRYKVTQSDIIKLPSYCVINVEELLQIEGVLINDGLITEV